MAQWPPSPSVEDEKSALAKEHSSSPPPTDVKPADEQSVPSRGSVDQFPIILDSTADNIAKGADRSINSHVHKTEINVSKSQCPRVDKSGLPTPPSSDNESRGRSRVSDLRNSRLETQYTPRSKSYNTMVDARSPKIRPSVPRIQTTQANASFDVKSSMHVDRLGPSIRPEVTGVTHDFAKNAHVQYMSPDCTTSSPVSLRPPSSHLDTSSRRHDRDSSTESVRRPRKVTRFADVLQGPGPAYGTPRGSSVPPSRLTEVREPPFGRRREDDYARSQTDQRAEKESSDHGAHNMSHNSTRVTAEPVRSIPTPHESQSKSTITSHDQSRDPSRRDSTRSSAPPQVMPRPTERLRSSDVPTQSTSPRKASLANNDNVKYVYYVKDDHYSITPPSVTTPKHMEDYFSQAFERNSQKPPRYSPRSSFDGSAYLSPPASPPRTPRGERSSKVYVESPCMSPRRMSRQSRLPSWDENQYVELKASKSLLSQATTAATIAAKISPPNSRTLSSAAETMPSGPARSTVPISRSRPVSPTRESRSESARRRFPSLPPSDRKSFRDEGSGDEAVSKTNIPPARAVTWNSHDIHHRTSVQQFGNSLHVKSGLPSPLPSPLHTATPLCAGQPTPENNDMFAKRPFVLPRCPRPRPLPGLQDWSKIRGIHGFRVCPTCTGAISDTKYGKYLEPSSNDRDEQAISCGMSKSWIRVAFMQSLNRNKHDLKFVEDIVNLKNKYRPCAGPEEDSRCWFRVKDIASHALIPNFYVCSTCVRAVDKVFPDIPDQFQRDEHQSKRVCNMQTGSRDFIILTEQLDLLAKIVQENGSNKIGGFNPFVSQVHNIRHRPTCAREKFITNGTWHFMDDLPEFTVCEACFVEIVIPLGEKPIAKSISRVSRPVLRVAMPGSASPAARDVNHSTSCQLYSDKMRRYFVDAVDGLITYEKFKSKAKERFTTQWQLNQTSKRYEEDQKAVEFLKAEVDKKLKTWLMIE